MQIASNSQTQRQAMGVILLSVIDQCNAAKLPRAEYEAKLLADMRERTGQEMPLDLLLALIQ